MTELAPSLTAARRRRARSDRRATLSPTEPGRFTLTVLLPSADAATILLGCEEATDLVS